MSAQKKPSGKNKKSCAEKLGIRIKRCYNRIFRDKNYQNLKKALKDKYSVLMVEWQLHYLTITYTSGETLMIYGNLSDAKRLLRSCLFRKVRPSAIVNLFYFDTLNLKTSPPTIIYPDKMEVVMGKTAAKSAEKLNSYLNSNQFSKACNRLKR
jgi:hypothetical protein